jgi:hypothetical protein
MLDRKSFALLKGIIDNCSGTEYKIFSIQELLDFIPKVELRDDELTDIINALSMNDFISVKYQDENEICLRPLLKGKTEIENRLDKESVRKRVEYKCFVYSFFGGVVGAVLSAVIYLTISMLWGV